MAIHSSVVKDLMFQLSAGQDFILSGDFNIQPSSACYQALTEKGYTNRNFPESTSYEISYRPNSEQVLKSAYREKNGTEPVYTDKACAVCQGLVSPGVFTSGDILIMPPKKGGTGANKQRQHLFNCINAQQGQTAVADVGGTMTISHSPRTKASTGTKAGLNKQSNFSIAPLILEGVKLNKLQLNDVIKQHLKDLRISDIQLSRAGNFTIYAIDVNSFNRLLNELTPILATNGQGTAKIYVPRSIQRIKDTEKVAFVKNVDIEIPESRIIEAL
ncbi:unnamed protein product [Rotaria sp. Silwood2]|nr:unnamed protein product [Rotaria sp. Silwood2]